MLVDVNHSFSLRFLWPRADVDVNESSLSVGCKKTNHSVAERAREIFCLYPDVTIGVYSKERFLFHSFQFP